MFGVGEGESSDDEVELGEGRRRFGKSTSSPALHLGEFGFEEQEQGEEAECFSDQSQEQARHHTHRRNSAPSPSPSARPRAPRSPITPHFAPLPSPPPSPRSGFSFNPPPLRRGFTMTPLRRSSPSASPRPSPSTTITDIRTPTSAPPARPHPIAHPKSSPSILRRPVEYEVSSFSVAAEVQGGGLARRRTDRRPQVLGAEQIERIADVWSERDATGLEKGQQLSLSGRRLTVSSSFAFSFLSPLADRKPRLFHPSLIRLLIPILPPQMPTRPSSRSTSRTHNRRAQAEDAQAVSYSHGHCALSQTDTTILRVCYRFCHRIAKLAVVLQNG